MAWAVAALIAVLLLINFPRQMLLLVGVATAALGLFLLKEYFQNEQHAEQVSRVLIEVDPAIPAKGCGEMFPISVFFKNGSKKTVNQVNWSFAVYRRGHSTNLAHYDSRYMKMDKILPPGRGIGYCYVLPRTTEVLLKEEMEIRADRGWVEFATN